MDISYIPRLTPLETRLRKKLVGSMESRFAILKKQTEKFRRHLDRVKEQLILILSGYQSYATSQDEFQRIFECLDSIDEMRGYFGRKTGSAAVFFPLNMPLYALILYGIFPALATDHVYIRVPQRMTDLIRQLTPVLALDQHFANIEVVIASREDFINRYVSQADIIIFTGKLVNAQYVLSKTKKNSLFLFNGWGCNPIVVGEGADLEIAASKTVEARLFSSGQDCAGPDTILVPDDKIDTFVALLKKNLSNIRIGSYTDRMNTVGPLSDEEQIRLISSILIKSSKQIVYGGTIDFPNSTIHPTIIVSDLNHRMNFEELFAPVLFINTYESSNQLKQYFENPLYTANEMYVTLFGRCDYIENLKRSIVVKEQVIFDIDRGNDEFGGYSMGASFVASNHRITSKPVLVPRDIWNYLQPGSSGYRLNHNVQNKISRQARKVMIDCFSSNLIFGFIFGSVARQEANGASDINSMVILGTSTSDQVDRYVRSLRQLHEQYQLEFRDGISVITMTVNELNETITLLDVLPQPEDISPVKDMAILIEALSGPQCGVTGNKSLCVEYGRKASKHSQIVGEKNQNRSKPHEKEVASKSNITTINSDADQSTATSETACSLLSQIAILNDKQLDTRSSEQREKFDPPNGEGNFEIGRCPEHRQSSGRSRLVQSMQFVKLSKRKLLRRLQQIKAFQSTNH